MKTLFGTHFANVLLNHVSQSNKEQTMSSKYVNEVLADVRAKNADQSEFLQAVEEVTMTLDPESIHGLGIQCFRHVNFSLR